jgi:uncharacterized protein
VTARVSRGVKSVALAIVAGALFGLGLVVSGMTVPARVTAFLDFGGAWDPTLAFVMGGAIAVHAPLVRLIRARATPLYDTRFHLPARASIDAPLVIGAAVFGVGWGLSGCCPGPAWASLATGAGAAAAVFVGASVVGVVIARVVAAKP